MAKLTPEQKQMIYNDVRLPVIEAAQRIDFGSRYQQLLIRFPNQTERLNDDISLERKQELVNSLALPMRYYKETGGYWRLNKKQFHRKDVGFQFEMRQWVTATFALDVTEEVYSGCFFGEIYLALLLHGGAELDFEQDWQHSPSPWCYCEADFIAVFTECEALFNELLAELPTEKLQDPALDWEYQYQGQ